MREYLALRVSETLGQGELVAFLESRFPGATKSIGRNAIEGTKCVETRVPADSPEFREIAHFIGSSVVRHTDGRLLRAARPRFTFSRISEALAVQINGLGSLLCCSTETMIVVTSSLTL